MQIKVRKFLWFTPKGISAKVARGSLTYTAKRLVCKDFELPFTPFIGLLWDNGYSIETVERCTWREDLGLMEMDIHMDYECYSPDKAVAEWIEDGWTENKEAAEDNLLTKEAPVVERQTRRV